MFRSEVITFPNQLTFIHTGITHAHLSNIYAFVRTGALYEETSERGYAHLLEHLLLKRLTTHRHDPLTKFCTSRGMYFNAETGREHTLFYITDIMPEYLSEAIEMMRTMLFEPVFTSADMEEEKDIVISELMDRMSSPHYKVQRAFSDYFFGSHPLGREVGGTIEDVGQADFEKLMAFYRKHYTTDNIIISTAGPTSAKASILAKAQQEFSQTTSHAPMFTLPTHIPPQEKDFLYTLDFAQTVSLEYFFQIPGREAYSEAERFAFYLYEDILGSSRYSRLFLSLREEKRLVYDVSAGTSFNMNNGSFYIDTSCKKEHVDTVATLISSTLASMRTDLVTDDELEEAKTNALIGYYQILDDVNKIASRAGHMYLTRGHILQAEESHHYYSNVTKEDIRNIANTYIHPQEAYSYVTYKETLPIPHLT